MFRCDGNVITDRPVQGQNCVNIGAHGEATASAASETPASANGASGSTSAPPTSATAPYKRPDRLPDWKPEPLKAPLETQKGSSPSQALAICSSSVKKCYEPGQRSLDQCWVSMPRCAAASGSDGKEVCCPSACVARYEEKRTAGATPPEATDSVLFGNPSCIPGVRGAIN